MDIQGIESVVVGFFFALSQWLTFAYGVRIRPAEFAPACHFLIEETEKVSWRPFARKCTSLLPSRVWRALADFQHVPGFVVDSKPDGEAARIITFSNGSTVKETLVTLDEDRHRLVYAVSSERITHHNASAELVAEGSAHCRFVWTTDVLPDDIAPYIDAQMDEGAKAMKAALEHG